MKKKKIDEEEEEEENKKLFILINDHRIDAHLKDVRRGGSQCKLH